MMILKRFVQGILSFAKSFFKKTQARQSITKSPLNNDQWNHDKFSSLRRKVIAYRNKAGLELSNKNH